MEQAVSKLLAQGVIEVNKFVVLSMGASEEERWDDPILCGISSTEQHHSE